MSNDSTKPPPEPEPRREFISNVVIAAGAIGGITSTTATANAEPSSRVPGESTAEHIVVNADVLLVTDSSRCAGALQTNANGTILLSAAVVRALEALLFGTEKQETPSLAELDAATKKAAPREDRKASFRTIVGHCSGLELASSSQDLGSVRSSEDRAAGYVTLDGKNTWRPGGQIISRSAGRNVITLVVSTDNLSGKVGSINTSSPLTASLILPASIQVVPQAYSCASCAACGLCGFCAVCGEINAAAGATATVGITGLIGLSGGSYLNTEQIPHHKGAPFDPANGKIPAELKPIQDEIRSQVKCITQTNLAIQKTISRLK